MNEFFPALSGKGLDLEHCVQKKVSGQNVVPCKHDGGKTRKQVLREVWSSGERFREKMFHIDYTACSELKTCTKLFCIKLKLQNEMEKCLKNEELIHCLVLHSDRLEAVKFRKLFYRIYIYFRKMSSLAPKFVCWKYFYGTVQQTYTRIVFCFKWFFVIRFIHDRFLNQTLNCFGKRVLRGIVAWSIPNLVGQGVGKEVCSFFRYKNTVTKILYVSYISVMYNSV